MTNRLPSTRAFTLIELLVVILAIGILIAVAAPSFLGQTEKAHDSAAKQNLAVAYKAAKASTVKETNQGSYDATEVMNEINASEGGRLNAYLGDCPNDATTDINDIVVDSSYTGGTNLLICNDPERKIWYLQVTNGELQPVAFVGEGDEVPGDTGSSNAFSDNYCDRTSFAAFTKEEMSGSDAAAFDAAYPSGTVIYLNCWEPTSTSAGLAWAELFSTGPTYPPAEPNLANVVVLDSVAMTNAPGVTMTFLRPVDTLPVDHFASAPYTDAWQTP